MGRLPNAGTTHDAIMSSSPSKMRSTTASPLRSPPSAAACALRESLNAKRELSLERVSLLPHRPDLLTGRAQRAAHEINDVVGRRWSRSDSTLPQWRTQVTLKRALGTSRRARRRHPCPSATNAPNQRTPERSPWKRQFPGSDQSRRSGKPDQLYPHAGTAAWSHAYRRGALTRRQVRSRPST